MFFLDALTEFPYHEYLYEVDRVRLFGMSTAFRTFLVIANKRPVHSLEDLVYLSHLMDALSVGEDNE